MRDAVPSNRVSFFGIAFVTGCQIPAWGVSRAHPIGMWANTQHATSPSTNHVHPGPIKKIKVEVHGLDRDAEVWAPCHVLFATAKAPHPLKLLSGLFPGPKPVKQIL